MPSSYTLGSRFEAFVQRAGRQRPLQHRERGCARRLAAAGGPRAAARGRWPNCAGWPRRTPERAFRRRAANAVLDRLEAEIPGDGRGHASALMRFRFRRRAEAELDEIAAYIARDNPARAVTFVRAAARALPRAADISRGAAVAARSAARAVLLRCSAITWCSRSRIPISSKSAAWCTARATLPTSSEADRS